MTSYRPVFIMGAPRSGTTLLASILSSRSDTIALPEMHYIHKLLSEEMIYGTVSKGRIADYLSKDPMFNDLDIFKNAKDINKIIHKRVKDTIFNIISVYKDIYQSEKNPIVWIEHSPHNFEYFNVLHYSFPNSKFIHIVRDGRAVYASTKETEWGYKDVITGAIDWRRRVIKCLEIEKLYPEKVFTVKYEDLIENPMETTESICNYAEINFSMSMLNSGGVILPSFARHQKYANQRPHKRSKSKWRMKLKPYEIAHFTAVNIDLLNLFDYETNESKLREIKGLQRSLMRLLGVVQTVYYQRKFRKRLNLSLK